MRDIEKKILKGIKEDLKILKRTNMTIDDLIQYLIVYKDFSNDNTEEYKKEIDKLMESLKQ